MSEITPPKALVYSPACYIVVKSGYEVAESVIACLFCQRSLTLILSVPSPCLQIKDGQPEATLINGPEMDIRPVEDTAKIRTGNAHGSDFQQVQETLSGISSQLTSLAEAQARSEDQILRTEKLCQENASQITLLSESQSTLQQHLQQLVEKHKDQMQLLTKAQAENTEQLQRLLASNAGAFNDLISRYDDWHVSQAQNRAKPKEAGHGVVCTHNVHPPPRKIDRPVVGYDYGTGAGSGRIKVDKAPGLLRC